MTGRIQRIAVLGGSRFIGHAIVEALLEDGCSVITVNRGCTPVNYSGPVERIVADRKDSAGYARALAGIDVDCVVDVTAYCANETRVVLDAFRNRLERFIQISTLSVYRQPFPYPISEDGPLETDVFHAYGFHKAECERILISESEDHFPWVILRLPAVFGPRDPSSREAYLYRQILGDKAIVVPQRPFLCQNLFVADAAGAVLSLLKSPKAARRTYNVGGQPFVLEEYVKILAGFMGREPRMMRAAGRVLKQSGADLQRIPYFFEGDLVLETMQIRDDIGFEPAWDLEHGLSVTLDWLSGSPERQDPVWWGLPWDFSGSRDGEKASQTRELAQQ
ncbi:MAG: NAD-dependent epimerase/dehydratase family protein [Nitrospirota bacterium]|nr:NAD-dependent epimerase/dehydratase family protein [Nitrospirota bacterium]